MKIFILAAALVLAACQTGPESVSSNNPETREADSKKVQEELEVSLKADRDHLAELRKDIPAEKQKQNDELALYLGIMKTGTENPPVIRERYNSMMSKRRQAFRTKVQKLRDDYRKDESKRREKFLKEHQERRAEHSKKKHDLKENREFFADQQKVNSQFFADEKDRRSNFESEINAQSKDFESYMRERNNEFNEQFRQYSKQFYEKPKEKKAVTGESGFDKLKNMDAQPLGTDQ